MKAIFIFDDDPETGERERMAIFQQADDMHTLLYDIDNRCRSLIKYDERVPDDPRDFADEIREMIYGAGLLF